MSAPAQPVIINLDKALARLKPLVATAASTTVGEKLTQENCLYFVGGNVFAQASGLTVSVVFDLGIDMVVAGSPLITILQNMAAVEKNREVEVKVSNGELRFKGSNSSAGLRWQELDGKAQILSNLLSQKLKWTKCPEGLIKIWKSCRLSALSDSTNRLLSNVHVMADCAEACNDIEAARIFYPSNLTLPSKSILLPFHGLDLIDPSFQPDEVAWTDKLVFLKTNKPETILALPTLKESEPYPELDGLFEAKGQSVPITSDFRESVQRAATMVLKFDRHVKVMLQDGSIKVRGQMENGWYTETWKCEYHGPELTFCIEPNLFTRMLEAGKIKVSPEKMFVSTKTFQLVCALQQPEDTTEKK